VNPTATALPLTPDLILRRPALFTTEPVDPATALGALFAADGAGKGAPKSAAEAEALRRLAGPLAPAAALLPGRERERAATLAAWIEALFATAAEGDRVEKRLERLNRSAFVVARALAGEPVEAPFARRFAEESRRRLFPRRSLDLLLAEARAATRQPLGSTPEEWEIRSRKLAGGVAEALVGGEPSPSTVEAANAFVRLVRLARVQDDPAAGFHLAIESPPTPSGAPPREAMVAAIAEECEAIHPLLLRGARAVGEVPLTFRAALAALLGLSIRLLGKIESRPDDLLDGKIRLGRFERYWTLRLARRERFA